MKIVLNGLPIAQARMRFTKRGQEVWNYDPTAKQKEKTRLLIKEQLQKQNKQPNLQTNDVYQVNLTFYLPISQSNPQSQKNAKKWGIDKCTQKPDIDNLEKYILDCSNGLLFSDDKNIILLFSRKFYSEKPRTEISIMKLESKLTDNQKKCLSLIDPVAYYELAVDAKEIPVHFTEEGALPEIMSAACANALIEFADKYADILSKVKKHCKPALHTPAEGKIPC